MIDFDQIEVGGFVRFSNDLTFRPEIRRLQAEVVCKLRAGEPGNVYLNDLVVVILPDNYEKYSKLDQYSITNFGIDRKYIGKSYIIGFLKHIEEVIKEDDSSYTQGYREGCSGFRWL